MGPSALRIAGITKTIESLGHTVREIGTVTAGGFETTDQGETKTRFLEEIIEVALRGRHDGQRRDGRWLLPTRARR